MGKIVHCFCFNDGSKLKASIPARKGSRQLEGPIFGIGMPLDISKHIDANMLNLHLGLILIISSDFPIAPNSYRRCL